ncbi:MAG: dihydrodipicolinate synthase family protein [Gemmatimonadetes bacterium]|nr:MAG: dihydrodipicolinate synthase family protein [Gemmatimonadota bacterium]
MRLWESARDAVPPDRLFVAGAGCESTRATVRLCRAAAEAGADAVLVQPPAFYRAAMSDPVIAAHYRAVADASPVPVIVYQVPLRFSTLEFATGLVETLARHPNIVGIKDSRGSLELVAELVARTPDDFQVLVGSGAAFYGALEAGAVGGILGVANLMPGECARIHAAFRDGDSAEAGRIQERVGPLHNAVVGGLGVPGVKAALDRLGLRGGDPRPPLPALDERGTLAVERALAEAGLGG